MGTGGEQQWFRKRQGTAGGSQPPSATRPAERATLTDKARELTPTRRARARLHERAEVLAALRQVLSGTSGHPSRTIVIEGLNGTGKTALLNASVMIARGLGLRVGRAQCAAAESSAPFGVVRQVFSSLLRRTAIHDTGQRNGTDLARRVLSSGLGPADDPIEVYRSLMLLLETTGEGPIVIAIDDVQWADPMSAGWLQFLSRRLTASSMHLIITAAVTRAACQQSRGCSRARSGDAAIQDPPAEHRGDDGDAARAPRR